MMASTENNETDAKRNAIPTRFVPKFWIDADGRSGIAREIRHRVDRLKTDSNADSYQREVLCERAVFIMTLLETAEREAVEGDRALDMGSYTQMVNSLLGLMKALGLEKRAKKLSLAQYVEERTA